MHRGAMSMPLTGDDAGPRAALGAGPGRPERAGPGGRTRWADRPPDEL